MSLHENKQAAENDVLAWGDMPYDSNTPAGVVHDYAVVRGDLSEPYARDQLALWIERYAAHAASEALRRASGALDSHAPWSEPCSRDLECIPPIGPLTREQMDHIALTASAPRPIPPASSEEADR